MRPMSRSLTTTSFLLIASGVFHALIWIIDGSPWEGPVSWRKPILFGLSTGLTGLSMAWVLRRIAPWKIDPLLTPFFAFCMIAETALITVQAWRGVPSHFNNHTSLDAIVFQVMGLLIFLATGIIAIWTLRCFTSFAGTRSEQCAAAFGMSLLFVGCLYGFWMVAYGTGRQAQGMAPEIYGSAGIVKFPHGIALHAIQGLIVATWLMRSARRADRPALIVSIGVGQVLLTMFGFWQTYSGRGVLEGSFVGGVLAAAGLALTAVPFLVLVGANFLRPRLDADPGSTVDSHRDGVRAGSR